MALRIKSHWHGDSERSTADMASAIAFIAWRIAMDKAINLHGEDFVYESDEQRLAVIREYLYFQLQIVDRMAYGIMDDGERHSLIVQLALKLAEHVQDNGVDLFGPGDYGKPFIETVNRRNAEYAELGFSDDGPSYPFMRHLGYEIQGIMGDREQNRWVIDQVMDSDGVDVYKKLSRAAMDLLG